MIGTYIKHPVYGLGKVIKIDSISGLVFFFEANKELHDGGDGSCGDHHGWWFSYREIADMVYLSTLRLLIERRQNDRNLC
jgi:hypothetical protein|nr:MAG TPA: Protein of unknown function (DUF3553) [Caudoviricetes sp.]